MLQIRCEPADATGTAVVHVTGEIDMSNADEVGDAARAARVGGATEVVVDLGGVSFIDSTGLGVLLGAQREASRGQAELYIRNARGMVARVLDVTGVEQALVRPERD